MKKYEKHFKSLFFGKANMIMTFFALLPLLTVRNPYDFTVVGYNFSLDILFFTYFLIEFIIRFKDRTLHGIYMYFDIIALISFLPFFNIFRLLLLARLFSAAFRVKGIALLARIIKENAFLFQSMIYIALIYMFVTSAIVFNVEPETFHNNYLYAFYWSGITLTTVGYGDIYPVTPIGQAVSLISSFLGIGIIALPGGVISSNFILKMKALEAEQNKE
ncbi:potassium channel family protein [Mollicutes bacterium LVI A0039]|nr:potassium channel family protein [Mollicutes bacterium LVI A0039]